MKIGIDIMGGDYAPASTVRGALLALKSINEDDTLVLIGDETKIREELKYAGGDASDFEIVHAPDTITMYDHPTRAIPQKPNSSIAVGFKLPKTGEIQGLASSGSTGDMLELGRVSCV